MDIEIFIEELKKKSSMAGLDTEKITYEQMKDGTYNFTYGDCQIGRLKLGKRSSKMQILTIDTVEWIENQTDELYLGNIAKWVEYAKSIKNYI